MEAEIKTEFEKNGFSIDDEKQVLKKCLTFCINYKLKPSDLVSSWEAYDLNRQMDGSTARDAEMDGFLLHLQNEQKEAIIKEEFRLHLYSSNDVDMILNGEHDDAKEGILGTPTDKSENFNSGSFESSTGASGKAFSSRKSLKLETPFGQRTRKFVVQFTLDSLSNSENVKREDVDGHEDDVIRKMQPRERCSLLVHGSAPEQGCRFMYDRVEDRFNALEERIVKHAKALVAAGLCEEPIDPTIASQKAVYVVGMICCDGEGRLNEKSVLLQSSVEHSGGQHVHLDLKNLGRFSIFPGQVVGIEGQNLSGHCFVASKMLDYIPFSNYTDVNYPPAKKQALDQELQPSGLSLKPMDLSMIIAAGPFTTTDNLLFEPLAELLAYASRKMPQLLVLLGPFVDSEHPDIKKGMAIRSFDDIFHDEVLGRLRDYVEYAGSSARVILVPSIRDANHDYVFPQPAFDIRAADHNSQINTTTNPGSFVANEVKVACCSVDILRHLGGEEISRIAVDGAVGDGDRRSRLAKHILDQHSFYPLYPPAETVPLDLSLAPSTLEVAVIPDILILPSDLTHFIKLLTPGGGEGAVKCLCVNPGRLARGLGGGTFAEISYHGSPSSAAASIIAI